MLKYRGQLLNSLEWIHGIGYETGDGRTFILPEYTFHITGDKGTINGTFLQVKPETFGRYTRLQDIRGKWIWEKCTVKCYDKRDDNFFEGTVQFGDGSFYIDTPLIKHYRLMDYEMEYVHD